VVIPAFRNVPVIISAWVRVSSTTKTVVMPPPNLFQYIYFESLILNLFSRAF
jgi:hypothetical protein